MVRKPEGGSPGRDHGIPSDDADDRSRALAAFFGVGSASAAPSTDGEEEAETSEGLAAFFEQATRSDAVTSTSHAVEPHLDDASAAPALDSIEADLQPPLDDVDELIALHDDEDLFPLDVDLDGEEDPFALDGDGGLFVGLSENEPSAAPTAGSTVAVVPAASAEPAIAPRTKRERKRTARAAATGPQLQGQFASTPRGVRAWGKGAWWAVGVSVVLVGLVVAASVYVAQTTAAQDAELRAAVADFEDAADAAKVPVSAMDAAYAQYETTAAAARAAADSAGPALSAVAGMVDQPTLDAATSAQGALVALLDDPPLPDRPAGYTAPAVETIDDVAAADAAVSEARRYSADVEDVTAEVVAATAAVTQQATALTDAQRVLAASLPATADAINAENPLAVQSFRDAVTAAAAAVGAAQATGGSGDAELLAYAAAVTGLRDDQVRAEQVRSSRRTTVPNPSPTPQPTTEPAPQPTEPAPVPTP